VKPEPHPGSPPAASERDLASILRRIELGDSSVTDLVYWLQMQEDFLSGSARECASGPPQPRSGGIR
jgi:hypothetical protein